MRCQIGAVLASLILLSPTTGLAAGQSSASKTKSRPSNVVSGTLTSTDPAAATINVKLKPGSERPFRYTEKTQMWRERRSVEISSFKPGDNIVVRFRKSGVGPATLYDLADAGSWAWVDRLRHETCLIAIKEIDEESLHATETGADFTYRVTDKTQWSKGGRPGAPSDFHSGDVVHVVPRMLPGGNTMALAVSDASMDAARLKERSRYTVSATIRAWNAAERKLDFVTSAGDERQLTLTDDCIVRLSGKDVPVSYLRSGQAVTLHLTRLGGEEQVIRQITIRKATSKRLPSRPGQKPIRKP